MVKRLGFLLILALAAGLLYNCRKDVVVEPPPSVVGNYAGTYSRVVQGTDSNLLQYVTWVFTSTNFFMDYDQSHYPIKDSAKVCDVGGVYEISAGISLTATDSKDSSRTVRTCNKVFGPHGSYQLNQSVAGEITMTALTQNPQGANVIRTIHLFKK
jgi:hypothetical protein